MKIGDVDGKGKIYDKSGNLIFKKRRENIRI
jgi:hypothetical protein